MREIKFTKMHGLGNDFIVIDGLTDEIPRINWAEKAGVLCDRAIGVGADGVILALPGKKLDYRMRIFNSDGSEAEMCGNGFRCMVRLLHDRKLMNGRKCAVETIGGEIEAEVVSSKKSDFAVRYCLGEPIFDAESIPVKSDSRYFINGSLKLKDKKYTLTALSLGNPHAVMFVDDLLFDWEDVGREIENHEMFPNRTNVEFVMPLGPSKVGLQSWERGAGPTYASGTGACAAVAAGVMVGLLERSVEVVCHYGSLMVEWSADDGRIYQTGPAEYSFTGLA